MGRLSAISSGLPQEPEDDECPAKITGTSSTHTLDSTTATTKTVWVIAKEKNDAGTLCYTSRPVYVTWNLSATLREIADALAANFVTPPSPTPAPGNNGKFRCDSSGCYPPPTKLDEIKSIRAEIHSGTIASPPVCKLNCGYHPTEEHRGVCFPFPACILGELACHWERSRGMSSDLSSMPVETLSRKWR